MDAEVVPVTHSFAPSRARKTLVLLIGVIVVPAIAGTLFYRLAVEMSIGAKEGMASFSMLGIGVMLIICSIATAVCLTARSVKLRGTVLTDRWWTIDVPDTRGFWLGRRTADITAARAVWFGQRFGDHAPWVRIQGLDARERLGHRASRDLPYLAVLPAGSKAPIRVPLTTLTTELPRASLEALAEAVAGALDAPNAEFTAHELREWAAKHGRD